MDQKHRRGVHPPGTAGGWNFRYLDLRAEKGWRELGQQAPGPTRKAYDQIVKIPRHRSKRQDQLRLELATKTIGGVVMEHWQYEVTGGGRIWYAIDEGSHTVILTHASVGHPKQTDR
jgi:hypothetical protein